MTEGVVLLHGIARTAASMGPMESALRSAGFATQNLGYDSRRKPLDRLAQDIRPAVMRFAADIGGPIHFVTHSMGGLVVRMYLAGNQPENLGRVVMLGPPNHGSAIADRLHKWSPYRAYFGPAGQQLTTPDGGGARPEFKSVDYRLGIIAGSRSDIPLIPSLMLRGPHDGRVTVLSTRLDGMADHIVIPAGHRCLMRHPEVIRQTIAFLRLGRFSRPDRPHDAEARKPLGENQECSYWQPTSRSMGQHRRLAAVETGLAIEIFPIDPPFDIDELRGLRGDVPPGEALGGK